MPTPDLTTYARRHLGALHIPLAQAQLDALAGAEHPAYSTVKSLDVLRRLRAQAAGHPTPTAEYAPILTPTFPITITADGPDMFSLAHDQHSTSIPREALLDYLRQHNLAHPAETPRTLIVDTTDTLRALTTLSRHSGDPTTAAVLDWWTQRADHPGTSVTYVAALEPRKRWVTGHDPEAEADPALWARWLGIPPGNTPAQDCEAIIRLTAAGLPLDGLVECHGSDLASWKYLTKRNLARYRPGVESRRDAAMGLTTRNHASEYYASLRLSDPLVAQSAAREGHLVQGVVQQRTADTLQLLTGSAISRFRVGAEVQAWAGPVAAATNRVTLRSGHVSHIAVTPAGHLDISIADTVVLAGLVPGDVLTLRPRVIDAHQQIRLRTRYSARLRDQRNWLSRTLPPPTQRRTVPLDVVIAAAPETED